MFKVKSAEIDERSTPLLREIADTLQRNPQATHVQVQGHTDNRGDSAANQELSQQRAESVVHWLVDAGVDSSRLEAKGFGDSRPLVPNLTPDNRARNRRVQFIIKKAP
jgi:OmpA-OmpF porin, OOP family